MANKLSNTAGVVLGNRIKENLDTVLNYHGQDAYGHLQEVD